MPDTSESPLEYFIRTDDPLLTTLQTSAFAAVPDFCPTAFTVTVAPSAGGEALPTSYYSFDEDTQQFRLEITDSVAAAGSVAPYETEYTVSVQFDVSNGLTVTNTDTFTFRVLVKNPCVNFGQVTLSTDGQPALLTSKTYFIGDDPNQFVGPSFTYSVDGSSDFCGPIQVTAKYGDGATPPTIDSDDMPLAYSLPNYTIDSDDDSLIGLTVPYYLSAVLQNYAPVPNTGTALATSITFSSTIRYLDACPVVGSGALSWATFEPTAGPNALTTDAYSGTAYSVDADDLFDISPDFCDQTITYECTQVTGPNVDGEIITYTGFSYPKELCALD